MSLYDRLLEEARERGIEHQPPATDLYKETNPELRTLRNFIFCPPTSRWSAMAYRSLQRRYPAAYERFLLEKGGGRWLHGFGLSEDRG